MRKWAIYVLGLYILMAFTWWTILLLKRNDEITALKIKLSQHDVDQTLYESKKRQAMIIGEGLVLGISIIIGVAIVFRSFKKELQLTKNQNNFLLSVSHELKSPLTSIKLSLDTIRKRVLDIDKIKEINEIAYKESNRLEKLIEELLMTTKLESGYVFKKEVIDVITLMDDLLKVANISYPNIYLQNKITESKVLVQGDKILLRSAILNIIENAIKYGEKKEIKLELDSVVNKIIIKIADLGNGIKESEMKNVFQKFYRVGDEQTRSAKGVGLGLYLAKLIIDIHQGRIFAAPNSPKGTVFTIELNKIA